MNLAASAMIDFNASVAGLKVGMEQAARVAENNFKKIENAGKKLSQGLQTIAFGYTIQGALRAADSYNVLQTRIERATRATGDYVGVSNELFRISQQTGASLKDTTDVFQRLSLAAGNLGASNKQLVDLTATVEKLGVMGGASASALNAGLLQFGQAMGSGVVHAEEFNSLIENIPLVADKIAKGMGMTTASLRSAVLQGKVLSKDVFESLMKQAPEVSKEFAKLPPSLERSMNALQGSMSRALGEFDQSIGLTRTLAQGLNVLSDNAKQATNAIVGLAVGATVFKLLTFNYKALAVAATEAAVAMSANPMLALAAAAGVAVAAIIAFRDVNFTVMDQQVSLSSLGQATWEQIAKAGKSAWTYLSSAADSFAKTCQSLWQFLGDGFNAAFKQIGDAAKWVVDGALVVIQGFVDSVSKIPIIGDKFKEWGEGIKLAGEAAQGTIDGVKKVTKDATDGVVGFAKTIVGRAAEIEKAKQKISAPISTKVQGGGNPLQEWDKKAKEFFQHQMDINAAMLAGLTISKEAAELEKLKAEYAKKVKTAMSEGELKILEQILENRRAMATLNDFNGMSEQMRQEAEALGLQNTELEYQIPILEAINKLKAEGRAFTDDQIAALKAQAKANYEANKQVNVARDFEKFKKDMQQELAFLDKRQNYSEEEIAIQRELKTLREKGYSEEQLKEAEALLAAKAAREKYNDVLKQTNALLDQNREAFKDLITNKSLKNQIDMYDEVMKALGKDWRKGESLSPDEEAWSNSVAAQKTFLEDAKRAQDIIKESRTEQQKWADDLEELNRLASQGLLTFDQWSEAVKKASPEYKKIKDFAEDTAKSFTNALDDWIFKGKKLSEVFKDLAKNLAQSVAKKAVFDPLEKKLTELISGSLWGNKAPQFPGQSGSYAPNKLLGGLPFNFPAGSASSGPFGGSVWNPFTNPSLAFSGGALPGGLGGFGGAGGFATNPTVNAGTATINVAGPVTLTGGGGLLAGPTSPTQSGGILDGLKNTLSKLFEGFFSTMKNILGAPFKLLSGLFGGGLSGGGLGGILGGLTGLVSSPFKMLGGLFSGGMSGGGGMLGGLSQIGGLLNPLGLLGGIGKAFGSTMGGSLGSGLGSIAPLLNPLGLLGGIGDAFKSTMGGGNILTDLAPLLNPFGFLKGMGGALGGLFGGRALGGSVMAGKSYLVGERGPEIYTPGTGGYISPNSFMTDQEKFFGPNAYRLGAQDPYYQQMFDAVTMKPGGIPLYQQMQQAGNFQRDYSVFNSYDKAGDTGTQGWEVERLLAKRSAYAAMTPDQQQQARTTGEGYFNNEDSARLFALINNQSQGVADGFNRLYGEQLNAGVSAILNNDGFGGNLKSWAALTQGNKTWSAIGAGNNLMKTMLPTGNQLGNIVNRWSFAGVNPSDLVNRFSNTRDSIFDELEPYGGWKLQGYGYNSMGMGAGPGTGGETGETRTKWGAYNQEWGSGVGYQQGWMPSGTPFKNNSLLETGGNGVTQNVPGWQQFQYDPTRPSNQAKNNPFGSPGWSPWNVLPGVYGSSRNASGGFTLNHNGDKLPWQSALDYLSQMGYRPEAGWSLGDWFNTLHSMSSYMGFKQPNMSYLENIGTYSALRGFARGGRPAVGELSLVGEKGPELFVPDVAGKVVPFKKPGANGGVNVSVKILASHENFEVTHTTTPAGDPEIIIQEVLARAYNQKGKFANAVKNTRAVGRG